MTDDDKNVIRQERITAHLHSRKNHRKDCQCDLCTYDSCSESVPCEYCTGIKQLTEGGILIPKVTDDNKNVHRRIDRTNEDKVAQVIEERKAIALPIRRLIRRALYRLIEDISDSGMEEKCMGVHSNGDIGNVLIALHKMYLLPDGLNMCYLSAHTDKMKEVNRD